MRRGRLVVWFWLLASAALAGCRHATDLNGGATSREALVRRFVTAVEQRDTATLRALIVSPAEFVSAYYPTAREALPPYELSPDLMWFRLAGESERGIGRALDELGGRTLDYRRHVCGEPRREGANTLWGWCRVQLGQERDVSLFGLILERGGRFKFVSYANDF